MLHNNVLRLVNEDSISLSRKLILTAIKNLRLSEKENIPVDITALIDILKQARQLIRMTADE